MCIKATEIYEPALDEVWTGWKVSFEIYPEIFTPVYYNSIAFINDEWNVAKVSKHVERQDAGYHIFCLLSSAKAWAQDREDHGKTDIRMVYARQIISKGITDGYHDYGQSFVAQEMFFPVNDLPEEVKNLPEFDLVEAT